MANMTSQTVRKAVIPVAGLGTRFLPATKAIPKELLPLMDKPVLQHIVEEAVASGIEEIVFITSEDKQAIEQHFSRDVQLEELLRSKGKDDLADEVEAAGTLVKCTYVVQDEPLGLGHAVLQARDVIGEEPFLVFGGDDVVEGDIPAAQELIDVHTEHGGCVVGVIEVPEDAVDRYGIAAPKEDLGNGVIALADIVEKPAVADAPSRYAAGGRWLLTPNIFDELENTKPGAGGEIQLTDALRAVLMQEQGYAKKYSGVYRDCGNKVEYVKAVMSYAIHDATIGDDMRAYMEELLS